MSRDERGREEEVGWIVLSRELLADLLDLADAEVSEAREEIGAVARRAGWALGLVGLALVLLFWVVALLAYTLVAVLAIWLPHWAAALIVTAFFLLLTALLAGVGYLRIRRLENPFDILVRRFRDHLDWWRREVRVFPGGTKAPRQALDDTGDRASASNPGRGGRHEPS